MLPLTRSLESVDARHPQVAALRAGPLVLMRIVDENGAPAIERRQLLAAVRDPDGAHAWRAESVTGPVRLKAFPDIDAEDYSVYQQIASS